MHLAGSPQGSSCSVAAPVPTLNAQLAALGGFDEPYDPNNIRALDSLATQAAEVTSHNLIGTTPGSPVAVASEERTRPDALVLPLLYSSSSTYAGRVAGLAVFLRDCAGRVWYSSVADFTSYPNGLPGFPVVSERAAAASLHTSSPQLVYAQLPIAPLWVNRNDGDSIPAGPVYPA